VAKNRFLPVVTLSSSVVLVSDDFEKQMQCRFLKPSYQPNSTKHVKTCQCLGN